MTWSTIRQYLAREAKYIGYGIILVLMFSLLSFVIFDTTNALGDRKVAMSIRLKSLR